MGCIFAYDRGCSAIVCSTVDASRRARRYRNRSTHCCICTRAEWCACRVSKRRYGKGSQIDHCSSSTTPVACDLSVRFFHGGRWLDVLWGRGPRPVQKGSLIRRSDFEGIKSGRVTSTAADQIPTSDQSQNCK